MRRDNPKEVDVGQACAGVIGRGDHGARVVTIAAARLRRIARELVAATREAEAANDVEGAVMLARAAADVARMRARGSR